MVNVIKKQFQVMYEVVVWSLCLPLLMVLFMNVLFDIILVAHEGDPEMGGFLATLVGIFVALLYAAAGAMAGLPLYFNSEIGLGGTRKNFFLSYSIVWLLTGILDTVLLLALGRAEQLLSAALYPDAEPVLDLLPYILRYGVLVFFLCALTGSCAGILIMRYGKKAGTPLFLVWMLICLGGPRVFSAMADSPNTVLGKIGGALTGVFSQPTPQQWVLLGLAAAVLLLAVFWGLLRRQQVTG